MIEPTDRSGVIKDLRTKQKKYERYVSGILSARFLPIWIIVGVAIGFGVSLIITGRPDEIFFIFFAPAMVLFFWSYMRFIFSAFAKGLHRQLLLVDAGDLKESIEEDFFTKLVKINFKYIDEYYLQTREQADKSFSLTTIVAILSFLIIVTGIVMMFLDKTNPAYVTTSAGVLGQFVSAVFFYLYNRTILKMSEYHRKLVLTQNISLALKIAEGLPDDQRIKAQENLILSLSENINSYLTSELPEGVSVGSIIKANNASQLPPLKGMLEG